MATVFKLSRTCNLILCLILFVSIPAIVTSEAVLNSFSIVDKKCDEFHCVYLLSVRGSQLLGHLSWRLTSKEAPRGGICESYYPNYELREVESSSIRTIIKVFLPRRDGKFYFCLRGYEGATAGFSSQWVHQGSALFLEPKNSVTPFSRNQLQNELQETQNLISDNDLQESQNWVDISHDTDVNFRSPPQPPKHEREDIQVLHRGKYSNLNSLRDKREIIKLKDNNPINIDLISKNKETTPNNINANLINNVLLNNNSKEDLNVNLVNKSETLKYNQDINGSENENSELIFKNNVSKRNYNNYEYKSTPPNESVLPVAKESFFNKIRLERQVIHPGVTGEVTGDVPIAAPEAGEKAVGKGVAAGEVAVLRQTTVAIEGLRIEESVKDPSITNGIPSVLTGTPVTVRLFGQGLTDRTVIAFTRDELAYKDTCKFFLKGEYQAVKGSVTKFSALFKFTAPEVVSGSVLYVCAKTLASSTADISKDTGTYYAMGSESYKAFATHDHMLPLYVSVILIILTLCFSSLFSGLNLGLMSLDKTQLKILANTGTEAERSYARTIMPVREKGNYLLCSILLGNVLVNSIFTILLDELTSGLFAVIFATLAIVLFGEITPQAVCSRHGLFVGAKSIMFTKMTMAITAPLAYPVSKFLDYILGEEIGNVYNRERLQELIKVTTADLDRDEVNIISGTLDLRKKKVSEIMTRLEDVFMLPITAILDFQTMSEIVKSGYSRIPVYENERSNIVTVLFIKDLAFVDPDDNTPLRTLCQYYQNPCNFVFEDVTLDVMFRQFKEGHKGHMAFVHRINTEGEGDPFYETIGLFTLEDVIEEMIQAEIVDETDVFVDNRSGRRRKHIQHKMQDFAAFAERHENQRVHISPQLTLATFQFLSSSVPAFEPHLISETVLRRLLKQDVIQFIRIKDKENPHYIYQAGKAVDYFVLILEGRVEVTVGRENLVFEAGPFTYFGEQALTQNVNAEQLSPEHSLDNVKMDSMMRFTFVPDYSVRAIADTYYLTVKRALYLAAKRATMMEKGALSRGIISSDQFDTDIDKLLQSVEDGVSISTDQKTPSRQISPNPPISPIATKSRSSPPLTSMASQSRSSLPQSRTSPLQSRSSLSQSRSSPPLASLEIHNGDHYRPPCEADEQEKLLK